MHVDDASARRSRRWSSKAQRDRRRARPDSRQCDARASSAACRHARMVAARRRSEQHGRVRQQSGDAQTVPPHRAIAESGIRDRPVSHRTRLHAHSGAAAARSGTNRHGLEPGTLAVVQSAITHQGTGWEYTIDELRRYFERVAARPDPAIPPPLSALTGSNTPPAFFDSLEHLYLTSAATLGRRTAELHLALASSSSSDFAPEPCDRAALNTLADQMTEHGTSSLARLRAGLSTLTDGNRALAESVLANATRAADTIRRDSAIGPGRSAHPRAWRLPPRSGAAD